MKKPKRRVLLRDPSNKEEREMLLMIEDARIRLHSCWLNDSKWRVDFKDVAKLARMSPVTARRFILGTTKRPLFDTAIRLGIAMGVRLTFVTQNSKHQPDEVHVPRGDVNALIRKRCAKK